MRPERVRSGAQPRHERLVGVWRSLVPVQHSGSSRLDQAERRVSFSEHAIGKHRGFMTQLPFGFAPLSTVCDEMRHSIPSDRRGLSSDRRGLSGLAVDIRRDIFCGGVSVLYSHFGPTNAQLKLHLGLAIPNGTFMPMWINDPPCNS